MISFSRRLDCPHSFAGEESPELFCDCGNGTQKCDGRLYDCCLFEKSFSEQLEILYEDREED